MSDMVRTWLDHTDKLDKAATVGPWEVRECEPCTERGREDIWLWADNGNTPVAQWMDFPEDSVAADAEWIAHARTALPAATAAIQAVLDLHPEAQGYGICANSDCEAWYPCDVVQAITAAIQKGDPHVDS